MTRSASGRGVRSMIRRAGIAFLPLTFVAALAACGNSSSSGGSSSGRLDKVKVTVSHWPTSGYSATYMVGKEKGFFKAEGIELAQIVPGAGGGTTVRSITEGNLDFGDVAPSGLVQAARAGAPLVGIGVSSGSIADLVWVAKKDSRFNSLKDFCGAGVWGITKPGSNSEALTALMLRAAGTDPKCVKTVSSGDLAPGLVLVRSGQIDASILTEPLLTTEVAKGDLKTVANAVEYLPNYIQVVTVASSRIIKEKPDLVRRFMKALRKSQEFIRSNPQEAGAIFAKGAGLDDKTGVDIIARLAKDEKYFTQNLTVDGLTSAIEGMKILGAYKGDEIPWKEMIDQQFLPENERIDLSKLPGYKN